MKTKTQLLLSAALIAATPTFATGLGGAEVKESKLLSVWEEIKLGGETMCTDGSEYAIYHQAGTSDNLHIFFQPGGACWDEDSCELPHHWQDSKKSVEGGIYYADALNMNEEAFQTGIYRNDNPNNPLKDWNKVVITYCSGDVHIGNSTRTYTLASGEEKTIHHRGQANSKAALKWIADNYAGKYMEKVFVSGESAGGHGAIYYLPHVADIFSKSNIFQLSDGNALTTERFLEITDWWGVDAETSFGFKTTNNTMNDGYKYALEKFKDDPRVTMMQQNTLRDRAMVGFQAKTSRVSMSDAVKSRWQQDMVYSTKELKEVSNDNYFFWISNCNMDPETKLTPHCLEWLDELYSCQQDGVMFYQWLNDILNKGKRYDVGERFLPTPLR